MKSNLLIAATLTAILTTAASAQDLSDSKCRQFRPILDIQKRAIERPLPPLCATLYGSFDEFSFPRCTDEMETYRQGIDDFAECIADEHKRAVLEFNAAVQNFNRRASN